MIQLWLALPSPTPGVGVSRQSYGRTLSPQPWSEMVSPRRAHLGLLLRRQRRGHAFSTQVVQVAGHSLALLGATLGLKAYGILRKAVQGGGVLIVLLGCLEPAIPETTLDFSDV